MAQTEIQKLKSKITRQNKRIEELERRWKDAMGAEKAAKIRIYPIEQAHIRLRDALKDFLELKTEDEENNYPYCS